MSLQSGTEDEKHVGDEHSPIEQQEESEGRPDRDSGDEESAGEEELDGKPHKESEEEPEQSEGKSDEVPREKSAGEEELDGKPHKESEEESEKSEGKSDEIPRGESDERPGRESDERPQEASDKKPQEVSDEKPPGESEKKSAEEPEEKPKKTAVPANKHEFHDARVREVGRKVYEPVPWSEAVTGGPIRYVQTYVDLERTTIAPHILVQGASRAQSVDAHRGTEVLHGERYIVDTRRVRALPTHVTTVERVLSPRVSTAVERVVSPSVATAVERVVSPVATTAVERVVVSPVATTAVERVVPSGLVERLVPSGVHRDCRHVLVEQAPRISRSVGPVERSPDLVTTFCTRDVAPMQTIAPLRATKIMDPNVHGYAQGTYVLGDRVEQAPRIITRCVGSVERSPDLVTTFCTRDVAPMQTIAPLRATKIMDPNVHGYAQETYVLGDRVYSPNVRVVGEDGHQQEVVRHVSPAKRATTYVR